MPAVSLLLNMKGIITCVLILDFVSSCLGLRWNARIFENTNFYNVMDYGAHGDGKSDDSQAFSSAWRSTCGAEGTSILIIPPGNSFMVTTLIFNGPCNATSVHIQLQGEIVAPSQDAWGTDKSQWIAISYVNGLTIDGGGHIDGHGSTWWQCKSCPRPTALSFHACNGLTVSGLRSTNSPGAHISINDCDGARFSNMNINAPRDSPNTDGFDISASKNILIEDSTIATGDDCIAINGGSSYINVTGVACGPGHGISIGSLGRNKSHETVEEVYVQNCSFTETSNGARIKTWPGGSGYARKITFEQINFTRAGNPIIIDQHYGVPYTNTTDDSAVQVSEVTYRGFNGTSADENAINLNCSSLGCFNIVLDQINIVSSQSAKKTYAFCNNAHGTATSTIPSISCLLNSFVIPTCKKAMSSKVYH